MATSITKLSIGIEADAGGLDADLEKAKKQFLKFARPVDEFGQELKFANLATVADRFGKTGEIAGRALKSKLGGVAGDIGGTIFESMAGAGGQGLGKSLLSGVAIGGGISLIGTLLSALPLKEVGQAISDLFSGEGTRLFNEELKTSAEWMGKIGRNAGTTKDILDSVAKKSTQFADEFQRITDMTRSGTIERVDFSGGSIARRELSGGEALNRLRQEAQRTQEISRMFGGREGADMSTQARQQLELIQRAQTRDARIAAAESMGTGTQEQRMGRNLAISSARMQFANPLGGDEMARQSLDNATMMAAMVGRTADEAELYRLRMAGASQELRDQVRDMQRMAEGRRMTEEFMDPVEKFKKERANIEALLKEGRIDANTAALATDRALRALGGPAELKTAPALLAGSQAALSAITRHQLSGVNGRRSAEDILNAANAQRAEQLRVAQQTRDELRRLNLRPSIVEASI